MKRGIILLLLMFPLWTLGQEITPYKFTDAFPVYKIPATSRFTTQRLEHQAPDIVYYFSKPQQDSYPIAILCEGSSDKNNLASVIHFHRYFLQECLNLGYPLQRVSPYYRKFMF